MCYITTTYRKQVKNRRVYSALNTLHKSLPNFDKDFNQFLHRRVSVEAKQASSTLKEGKPTDMTREAVANFSFVKYFDTLTEVTPLLSTTLVAAATKTKFSKRKVSVTAGCTLQS